jgi:hypothetical protein
MILSPSESAGLRRAVAAPRGHLTVLDSPALDRGEVLTVDLGR